MRIMRIERLRDAMEEHRLNGSMLVKPENIYYFTGFFPTAESFLILPLKRDPELLVTALDYREAKSESSVEVVEERKDLFRRVKRELAVFKAIGVEEDYLTIETLKLLNLGEKKIENISKAVSKLRSIKEENELKSIEKATGIAEKSLKGVLDYIHPGVTEREIATELEYAAKTHGAERMSFSAIVAGGRNSSIPHWSPSDRELKRGEPLLIDLGVVWNKYHAELSRTFHLGEPSEKFASVYNAVLKAQEKATVNVKDGEEVAKADKVARDALREYEEHLVHVLGHGIGLECHEYPMLTVEWWAKLPRKPITLPIEDMLYDAAELMRERHVLKEDMVVAIEPGVYLDEFGVRIEDVLHVEKKGAKFLSSFPRHMEDIVLL